jgi:hypothetical protein
MRLSIYFDTNCVSRTVFDTLIAGIVGNLYWQCQREKPATRWGRG